MNKFTNNAKCILVIFPKHKLFQNSLLTAKDHVRHYSYKTQPSDTYKWTLLAIPVISFGLGCWQVQRRWWKLDLIKNLKDKTTSPPILLPKNFNELSDLEYRQIKVTGKFIHDKEILIGPRGCIKNGEYVESPTSFLADRAKYRGFIVVTPFKLSGRDETILVNRGWVPMNKKAPENRKEGQVQHELEIVGILRLTEARPQFMPKNNPEKTQWMYRDLDAMGDHIGTSPVWIDAKGIEDMPEGWPIPNQTRVTLRNEHMSYILTWFGLSAATSFMWFQKFLKPLKR